ncbi:MAG: KEOPS complex subunit Pcc1 [Candidatus Hodarchaeota archaeon]
MDEHNGENNWPLAAFICIELISVDIAEIIWQALIPEITTQLGRRARADLKQDRDNLLLRIVAKDQIALRATMNSFLRWINGALSTLAIVETP